MAVYRPLAATILLLTSALLMATPTEANICKSPSSAPDRTTGGDSGPCEFWDDKYHELVLTDADETTVDVLIFPSVGPYPTRDSLATFKHGVLAWEAGIHELDSAGGLSHFDINAYAVGYDDIPLAALHDPEIVILAAEANPFLLFGIGLASPLWYCADSIVGFAHGILPDGFQQHEGSVWGSFRAECGYGGDTCFVVNTNFLLGGQRLMYDLNTHEFGHCLGVGHVGDAGDFDAKTVPMQDIMSYQHTPSQVHCVSTLNVKTLATIHSNDDSREPLPKYVHMEVGDYRQATCNNPFDARTLPLL